MKGDFSRLSFDPDKAYTAVLKQQGRVDLDADFNEAQAISNHLRTSALADVIGAAGAPGHGFEPTLTGDGTSLAVASGRIYVDGIAVANPGPARYQEPAAPGEPVQPNGPLDTEALVPPDPAGPALAALEPTSLNAGERLRTDLLYLQVWESHVTALEDPALREVALGGPDTTTRLQATWRLRLAAGIDEPVCGADVPSLPPDALGTATLSTSDDVSVPQRNLCAVAPDAAGYRGTENVLYRVEIHAGSTSADAVFKWSSENAALAYAVAAVDPAAGELTLARPPKDGVLALHQGDTIELYSALDTAARRSGLLATVTAAPRGLAIPVGLGAADLAAYQGAAGLAVRRWDAGPLPVGSPAALGISGIRVGFSATGSFRPGDHWLIPARSRDASYRHLADAPPEGIRDHFARLGLLHWWRQPDGSLGATVQDCRALFPPLTGLTTLSYVGGDGQQAMPGNRLPAPLEVRVNRGGMPVPFTAVSFTTATGTLDGSATAVLLATGADGMARVTWQLPTDATVIPRALATLATDPDQVIAFNAVPAVAEQVAYTPVQGCDLQAKTVAQALDELCARGSDSDPGFHVSGIQWGTGGGDRPLPRPGPGLVPVQREGRITALEVPGHPLDDGLARALTDYGAQHDLPYLAAASLVDGGLEFGPTRRGPDRVAREVTAALEVLRAAAGDPVVNDETLTVEEFMAGLTVFTDRPPARDVSAAAFFLTAELPLVSSEPGVIVRVPRTFVAGFLPTVLRAGIAVRGQALEWKPVRDVAVLLNTALATATKYKAGKLLVRLTLKGSFIRDESGELYLDGEDYGLPGAKPHGLLPLDPDAGPRYSGDSKRGGDFGMWFWISGEGTPAQDDLGFVLAKGFDAALINPILSWALDRKAFLDKGLFPDGYVVDPNAPFDPDKAVLAMREAGLEMLPVVDEHQDVLPEIIYPESLGRLLEGGLNPSWERFIRGTLSLTPVPDGKLASVLAERTRSILVCPRSVLRAVNDAGIGSYDEAAFVVL